MSVTIPRRARPWLAFFCFALAMLVLREVAELDGVSPTPEAIRDVISSQGPDAPLFFIALLTVRPFVFFPCAILFAAAGLAFGWEWGAVYSCAGYLLGAAAGFGLARLVGRESVEAEFSIAFPNLKRRPWGPALVFFMNLVPVVPNGPVNFAAGLSAMRIWVFLGATLAGIAPWAVLLSCFGDAVMDMNASHVLAASAAALAVFLVVMLMYWGRFPHGPAWVPTRSRERP